MFQKLAKVKNLRKYQNIKTPNIKMPKYQKAEEKPWITPHPYQSNFYNI
jgi:hypothetical protein